MHLNDLLRSRGYDLPAAGRAIRAIMKNPDDLPQVFVIIDALSGRTCQRLVRRLGTTSTGQRVRHDGNRIGTLLRDRAALRRLPEGSLGRVYLEFVEREGISPEGIEGASAMGRFREDRDADEQFVHDRLRDTHDLWHAVTGYQGDVVGELALLAFTLPQTLNPAIGAILVAAMAKGLARGHYALIADGFRRGMNAEFFFGIEWESLLAEPVDTLRRELRVGAPRSYTPVRTADLRAEGVLEAA
jgi:ubiquinone biosynthesis protein COQ4